MPVIRPCASDEVNESQKADASAQYFHEPTNKTNIKVTAFLFAPIVERVETHGNKMMIENYEEIINNLTREEAMEIISKMGMNMTDHPYLSKKRREELEEEERNLLKSARVQPPMSEEESDGV